MDVERLLIWIICLSSVFWLVQAVRYSADRHKGWIFACGIVLGVTFGLAFLKPALAVWIGGSLWLLFLLIPKIGRDRVEQLIRQESYREARRLSSLLRWLHPADGWQEEPQLLSALETARAGNLAKATKILKIYQLTYPSYSYYAQALVYGLKADWQGCLIWMQNKVPQQVLLTEPNLLVYYLRALGETGDLNGLLQSLALAGPNLNKRGDRDRLNLVKMFALAFCGQVAEVRLLFQVSLAGYSKNMQKFWLLTALMFSEKRDYARQQLLTMRMKNNLILSNAIDWRLCNFEREITREINGSSQRILNQIKLESRKKLKHKNPLVVKSKKVTGTFLLIGVNLIFFGLELWSGSTESIENLYHLGALSPPEVFSGQWWRIITANFLHSGWLHLITNLLGLYFLGRFVESSLGVWRYLVVYLLSGIGAMLLFAVFAMETGDTEQILVGASAAIMGLIGAIFAIFMRDWLQEKSQLSLRRVKIVLLIIGFQSLFDIIIPDVSLLSHLLGLTIGFMVGIALLIVNR